MIIVVVLQNCMDLLKGELGSTSDACVTTSLDTNQLTGMEAERVCNIKEEDIEEPATIPLIKTEPSVSGVSVLCIFHTGYIHICLPMYHSVLMKRHLTVENGFQAIF